MVYRTLTTFPVASGKESTKLVADLATDTGTPSNGGKTWKFTLKHGPKWEDGKAITCADFQYGISRTFAIDVLTGGPNYAIQFLDIPKDSKGASVYKGPYATTPRARPPSTRPCSCAGNDHHLQPQASRSADFNYALYLPAFAPYRKDQDKGDKSNYAVFSNGPYKLQGTWTKNKGGTFVRNPNWDPKTDPIRKANPDQIIFTEGLTDEVIAQRLISDQGNDKNAVTDRRIVPSFQPQVLNNPQLKARSELVDAPYVDYLRAELQEADRTRWSARRSRSPRTRPATSPPRVARPYGRPAQTLVEPGGPRLQGLQRLRRAPTPVTRPRPSSC